MPNIPVEWLMGLWIANQILSALVQALPQPTTVSSGFYTFFYKFMSLLISDFKSFAQKIPPPTITSVSASTTTTTTLPVVTDNV